MFVFTCFAPLSIVSIVDFKQVIVCRDFVYSFFPFLDEILSVFVMRNKNSIGNHIGNLLKIEFTGFAIPPKYCPLHPFHLTNGKNQPEKKKKKKEKKEIKSQ